MKYRSLIAAPRIVVEAMSSPRRACASANCVYAFFRVAKCCHGTSKGMALINGRTHRP